MKIRQIFEELTTKPNEFEIVTDMPQLIEYDFSFKDSKGNTRKMEVGFTSMLGLKAIHKLNVYEVDFSEKGLNVEDTNYGNPDKVFATVIAIIKDFLSNKINDGISFRGADYKRGRVFRRLVPQFITNDFVSLEEKDYSDDPDDDYLFVVRKDKAEKLKQALKEE